MDMAVAAGAPAVTEKAFEEYHLYTLARPTTLLDRQTKQVEFVRAPGVKSKTLYVYDGAKIDWRRWRGYPMENLRQEPSYGTESNTKVWVMREFKNSQDNHLGLPLPKGRMRFYRQDTDGQVEFTGENTIDHTPKDELIRVYTGNAFDLVGERRRTDFRRKRTAAWFRRKRIQPAEHTARPDRRQFGYRNVRDQGPQPQAGACRDPRGRTPLPLDELGHHSQEPRLSKDRQPADRVPGDRARRWRGDGNLYGGVLLVSDGLHAR